MTSSPPRKATSNTRGSNVTAISMDFSSNQESQQKSTASLLESVKLYDLRKPTPISNFMDAYRKLKVIHQSIIESESSQDHLFTNINTQALSSANIQPRSIFDQIEKSINEEVTRTEHRDAQFDGVNFSKLENVLQLNRANIPTEEELRREQEKNALMSFTKLGRILNGKVLPRKEKNYLTRKMREMRVVEQHRDIKPGTVVCQIAIHHPDKNIKQQEFMVLGTQYLTDLKDVIYCLYDHVLKGKETNSGYFFIEDTFYVDTRAPDAVDYSKEVIEWTKSLPKGSPYHEKQFQVLDMQYSCFLDLNVKIGERYLYCHQGDCMHYIVFTDVRFWHEHVDEKNEFLYPYRIFQAKLKRKKCYVCNVNCAEWVTYNDEKSPTDPTFYCGDCFRAFHYDEDGSLSTPYAFEAYEYTHE